MSGEQGEQPEPDDAFDRALRSLTEGATGGVTIREPSAAEREKLARKSRKQQKRHDKRYAKLEKKTRKDTKRAQKRARKAQRATWGTRRVRRAPAAWAAAIIVLAGALVFALPRLDPSPIFSPGAGGVNDTQTVTNGAIPSVPAVSPLTESGPPADPFSGTPANKWADGATGIVIPTAKPVGDYTTTQVADAYQTTKRMLVAANLDRQTLNGGAPTAFASLLTQQQRTYFMSNLDKIGLAKDGAALSSRGMVTTFAPGTTRLIGSVIKVHGTMNARSTTDEYGQPVLEINIDYAFAYAVEPPKAPADWMRIVVELNGPIEFGDWSEANSPFEPWVTLRTWIAGARCGTRDGYIHPDYPEGPADSVAPSGPAVDPYALNGRVPDGCESTTGT
jgi:hypothetical protein